MKKSVRGEPVDKFQDIDRIFHPKSIALVGTSPDPNNWAGQMIPEALVEFKYDGNLFFVSRKSNEMWGFKTYPSIKDIPVSVDYVICSIAARFTPKLMEECASKGVRAVHLFTSGFSETGEEEGMRLEEKITQIARDNGIRIIGPNSPGIYCPESRLTFSPILPKESGPVACLSQSGGHCIRFLRLGGTRGLRFSKVVAYGNGCDLSVTDFLEYLAHDQETKVIALYIEGIRDGRRFFDVLKNTAKSKPVVVHKGGHTNAGTRAAASHTGSLTGEERIWDALCKQASVIRVHSIDEVVDTALAFVFMTPPKGKNVAVVGYGGGVSVQAADDCESAGLSAPLFPQEIRDRLRSFTPDANNSVRNPVDTQWLVWDPGKFVDTVRIVSEWGGIDFLIMPLAIDMFPIEREHELLDQMIKSVTESKKVCSKPMVVVLHEGTSPEILGKTLLLQERLSSLGLPVYPTLGRAAKAIGKFIHHCHLT
ncbi:MAG: CoA-binding protein [Desulfobacterales bacterium]|nr:CoA-binding protein [Desulfobacterales bacterium]